MGFEEKEIMMIEQKKNEVFISYSRADLKQVLSIKAEIENTTGILCWMDLENIESGQHLFPRSIVDGIRGSSIFLFMLSEMSQKSEFALHELYFARKKGKHVVIINIDECRMDDEFEFLYGLTDIVHWGDLAQREKLYKNLCLWHGNNSIVLPDELFNKAQKLYWNGNYKEAFPLFKKIAEQGDARAQTNLGLMFRNGKGVEVDYLSAIYWYKKAANQGDSRAQYALGIMYMYSRGVEHDIEEATKWFHLAAEQGHMNAQKELERLRK